MMHLVAIVIISQRNDSDVHFGCMLQSDLDFLYRCAGTKNL